MQSTSEGCLNITELAIQLKKEKIFINSERQLLQQLNADVEKASLELLQVAWICSQQRQNLTNLITSRFEADSIAACQRASLLERTTFIDAHKVFRFREANSLGELLGWLRDSPHLVALCLLLGEDNMPPTLPGTLVSGLYGSCRSHGDRTRLLAVLRSLIKHQMAQSPEPRKLFRTGKCALAQLYAVYRDGDNASRQFLVAALQAPVMSVLHEDEFFLDIDPDKAMERFSPNDRLKKFGQTNSAEYAAKVARYRKWTVQSLYNLTCKFIASLKEHWANYPPTMAWIVQQVVHLLRQHSRISERELHFICTDLVLNQLICPAIVNPEAHGVVEVPISYIARFNLIQIAQIIQMLCLAKYQEVEPKVRDLYLRFDRSCVWSLLEGLTSAGGEGAAPAPPQTAPRPPPASDLPAPPPAPPLRTEPPALTGVALATKSDLNSLITFLRHISSKLNNNTPSMTSEEASSGSEQFAETSSYNSVSSGSSSECEDKTGGLAALLQSIEPNYRSRLHDLLRKMPDLDSSTQSPVECKESPENGTPRRSILAKVPRPRLPRSPGAAPAPAPAPPAPDEKGGEEPAGLQVLIVKLASIEEEDCVGLVPESKVLECYYGGSEAGDGDESGSALVASGPGPAVQKRTRFSVSHDEVSLGNTSDNLEAVSEAASNHSVTSSLELETEDQNDNLSDMVSANVSGRGSPNISGRETPSSQVTDGGAAGDEPPRRLPQNAPVNQNNSQQAKLLKQTRNEIEDKFCKFEIKKLLEGDETVSIMSDTWSTDVLASDSETIGDTCDQAQSAASQGANTNNQNAPDVSETASESAWSMDVLASDSDRNTEVDTDDCVSVAARSDTSWPRRPSNHEESTPVRQAHQNIKRPDVSSPRHTSRPNLPHRTNSYLSATAQLSRGAELDLMARSPAHSYAPIEHRKNILVNGYPVMTCYTNSAPESPSTSAAVPLSNDVFDYVPQNDNPAQSESTLEGHSDATSQWVDDSFPSRRASPPYAPLPSTSKAYENDDLLDRSLNSSESSFNAMSASQYDRRFDSGIETGHAEEPRPTISELMTRMSSATITSNLASGVTSRVKCELRTSVVSISCSRVEKRHHHHNSMTASSLSVNSTETSLSDKSSSQDVNSEIVTERRVTPPPKPSTGAIPKSISFDASAEKTQRRRIMGEDGLVGNLDELKNNVKRSGGNLLHKIKMFRQKGRAVQHGNAEVKLAEEEVRSEEGSRQESAESSEDILAKYRRKTSAETRPPRRSSRQTDDDAETERSEGVVDLNDPDVFNSMKRRLRMVMSNPELHCVEYVPNRCTRTSLIEWVRAAAVMAGSEASGAHAAELARALALAAESAPRLAAALRADLAARRPYAAYLASCRAGLTHTLYALNNQMCAIRAECRRSGRAAAAARALDQLERGAILRCRPAHLLHYSANNNGGELMDEKASILTANIKAITAEVKADPSWEGASASMLEMVEVTVERAVFARVYLHVMFPNGDGDIARDQVLSEHIRRLSASTQCSSAGVPARHMWAAPFPRAQLLLSHLAVYRTPRDKLSCIMRCVTCIMAVLGLSEGATPSADDLTPVLIYVIIRVNPPSLLSTIELVNALGGPALQGEALYWWTHFCAAVAYIKTMDYPRTDS